jgi:alpha-L-fucosidase
MWPHAAVGDEEIAHPVVRKEVHDLLRLMKELQPDIIFNDRGTGKYGGFYTPEQQVPVAGLPGNWESNITITNNRGFWYKGENVSAKSNKELIRMLVDIASKGGNFLMNVGPRPDGELSKTEYDALAGIGKWMSVNGESIYGTRKGQFLQIEWGRSTTKGSTIYLHVFDWPKDGQLRVPGVRNDVVKAYLLADQDKKPLAVASNGEEKVIGVGTNAPDAFASVVVVELKGEPDINNVYRQKGKDPIELGTYFATIESKTAKYNFGKATRNGDFIQDIKSTNDRVSWDVYVSTPGRYKLSIIQATQMEQSGSKFTFEVAGQILTAEVLGTASWEGDILQVQRQEMDEGERHNNLWLFKDFDLGTFTFDKAGRQTIVLKPDTVKGDYLMFLKSATLTILR